MKKARIEISNFLIVGGLMGLWGCNNAGQNKSTDNSMRSDTVSVSITQDDRKFMLTAAQINLLEIQVGKLAQQRGMSTDVRQMGKMLEDDHSKLWNELVELAKRKSVTLPSALDNNSQNDYDKLSNQKDADFDKSFTTAMVDGHKDAILLFQNEAKETKDDDLGKWATQTQPVLQKHLEQAQALNDKIKS